MYESYGTYVNDEYIDNHDYDDDDADDDNDHKKDSYTAAGAAPTQTRPDAGGTNKKTITTIITTLVYFLAGVLKIKIQLRRSLTRRWELRRPSTIC